MDENRFDEIAVKLRENQRLTAKLRDTNCYADYAQRMAALSEDAGNPDQFHALAGRIDACGAEMVMACCPMTGKVLAYRPRNRCESWLCSFCGGRRARRKSLLNLQAYAMESELAMAFITLTFCPQEEPMSFRGLREASHETLRKLRRHVAWRHHVVSAIACYEAPWQRDRFNRHYHVMTFGDNDSNWMGDLATAWQSVGGGRVHMQAIHRVADVPRRARYGYKGYPVSRVPGHVILEVAAQRKGMHLVQKYGVLRGWVSENVEGDESSPPTGRCPCCGGMKMTVDYPPTARSPAP